MNENDIRVTYPQDITPTDPGSYVEGIIATYEVVDLGGFDYYVLGLIDPEGGILGHVKVGVGTADKSIGRHGDGLTIDTAMNEAIPLRISRSQHLSKSGKPFWNLDRLEGLGAPTKPAPKPVAKPAPAPTKAVATATGPNTLSVTQAVDVFSAQEDRYERYMSLVEKLLADKRLVATDTVLNFDLNAAAFAILKGGW